jgi:hypothetical protein
MLACNALFLLTVGNRILKTMPAFPVKVLNIKEFRQVIKN